MVSVLLGIMIALTISMATCDVWTSRMEQIWRLKDTMRERYPLESRLDVYDLYEYKRVDEIDKALDDTWPYLPMARLYDVMFDVKKGQNNGSICMVVAAIVSVVLSVMIMEGKSANKAWRQKMLQAIGIGALIVLASMTGQYAWLRSYGEMSTPVVLIPVILMTVPLVMLKKTRVRKEARTVATETPTEN